MKLYRIYEIKKNTLDKLLKRNNLLSKCIECSCSLAENAFIIRGTVFKPYCSIKCAEKQKEKL